MSCILLTHLGPKPFPAYGYDCAEQARLFNRDERIVLVVGDECGGIDESRLASAGCEVARTGSLGKTFKHRYYDCTNLLRFRGLGGFWLYATERLFAVEEAIRRLGLEDVIHIENDVLIYFPIARHLVSFRRSFSALGVVRDNDSRCLASLLYVKDASAIGKLCSSIAYNLLSRRKNDMELLSMFTKGMKACQLPIATPSYTERVGLVTTSGQRPRNPRAYVEAYSSLGMIFDGAAFGQFLGGIDKINSKEDTRGFINETSYVNPSKGKVLWRPDEAGRLRPYFALAGEEAAIANLHIHSKNLESFRSGRITESAERT